MTFRVKIHVHNNEKLVAICDSRLIGSEIEHKGVVLRIQSRFYGDIEMEADEVLVELQSATSYNVIGKNICHLLVKKGYIHPKTIIWMDHEEDKIGHAIVVR